MSMEHTTQGRPREHLGLDPPTSRPSEHPSGQYAASLPSQELALSGRVTLQDFDQVTFPRFHFCLPVSPEGPGSPVLLPQPHPRRIGTLTRSVWAHPANQTPGVRGPVAHFSRFNSIPCESNTCVSRESPPVAVTLSTFGQLPMSFASSPTHSSRPFGVPSV